MIDNICSYFMKEMLIINVRAQTLVSLSDLADLAILA